MTDAEKAALKAKKQRIREIERMIASASRTLPFMTGGLLSHYEGLAEEHARLEAEVHAAEMAERHRKQAARQRPQRRLGGPPYPTVP